MHCARMGVYDNTPNSLMPVIPDGTFTPSFRSFLYSLTQQKRCIMNVVKRFPMNIRDLGITRLRVLTIRLNAYKLAPRGFGA